MTSLTWTERKLKRNDLCSTCLLLQRSKRDVIRQAEGIIISYQWNENTDVTECSRSLRCARAMSGKPGRECLCIPALQVHGPGTGEFTHQSFASGHAGDDSAGRDAFHDVVAVPRDEVAVVHDVFLSFGDLKVITG